LNLKNKGDRMTELKTSIKKGVLTRILKEKYYKDHSKKECSKLAKLFLKTDFPLNGITTYGKAFQFLDYIQELIISTNYRRI